MSRLRALALFAVPVLGLGCSSSNKTPCTTCDAGLADAAADLPEDLPISAPEANRDVPVERGRSDGPPRPVVDTATPQGLDTAVVDLRGPLSLYDAPYISYHDFDNGSFEGWFPQLWKDGTVSASDWTLIGGDTGWVYAQTVLDTTTWRIAFDGIELVDDQVVEARVRVPQFYDKEPSYVAALFGRYDPEIDSGYFVALRGDGSVIVRRRELGQNASWREGVNVNIQAGVWYTLRLEVIGSAVSAFLDGEPVYSVIDPKPLGAGTVAVGTYGATLEVDRVLITGP